MSLTLLLYCSPVLCIEVLFPSRLTSYLQSADEPSVLAPWNCVIPWAIVYFGSILANEFLKVYQIKFHTIIVL
jgi:hypothetical protein